MVLVKQVLDANVRPRVKADGSGVELSSMKLAINPFDEIAVEEAIRLKEAGAADEVVVITVGPAKAQDAVRTALAMGADRGIHVTAENSTEPLAVAKICHSLMDRLDPLLVIAGKQSIDGDCHQTGQMLAAMLGWGQALCASGVRVGSGHAEVDCEIDNGRETVRVPLPAVITTDLRLNTPRPVTLPNLMRAKSKPIATVACDTLAVDLAPRLRTMDVREPAVRSSGTRLEDAAQLAALLKDLTLA